MKSFFLPSLLGGILVMAALLYGLSLAGDKRYARKDAEGGSNYVKRDEWSEAKKGLVTKDQLEEAKKSFSHSGILTDSTPIRGSDDKEIKLGDFVDRRIDARTRARLESGDDIRPKEALAQLKAATEFVDGAREVLGHSPARRTAPPVTTEEPRLRRMPDLAPSAPPPPRTPDTTAGEEPVAIRTPTDDELHRLIKAATKKGRDVMHQLEDELPRMTLTRQERGALFFRWLYASETKLWNNYKYWVATRNRKHLNLIRADLQWMGLVLEDYEENVVPTLPSAQTPPVYADFKQSQQRRSRASVNDPYLTLLQKLEK